MNAKFVTRVFLAKNFTLQLLTDLKYFHEEA